MYESNHRHTYKQGIKRSIELIEELEPDMPIFHTDPPRPTVSPPIKKIEISDIIFDFDKYTLRPDSKDLLDSILISVKAFNPKEIEIIGHTDNIGTEAYNLDLSEKRAKVIETFILQNYIGYKGSIQSVGKGESDF